MIVLFDTNVVIDVLQNRSPWNEAGKQLFLAIANRQIVGCVTAKQIADIHFLSRRSFKGMEKVDEKCRTVISKILALFETLDTLSADCKSALLIENGDYEDALMLATAERCNVDCIVTRNRDHFIHSSVECCSPDEMLQKLNR